MRLGFLMTVMTLGPLCAAADAAKQNQDKSCGNTRVDIDFSDTVYNALNNNGEGKVGPRRLVVFQKGRIDSKGTRNFVAHSPMDIDEAILKIKKVDGRGKTTVAICATDPDDHQRVLSSFTIANGKGNVGTTWTRELDGIKGDRVSVRFAGKSLTNTMAYEVRYRRPTTGEIWEPTAEQLAPRIEQAVLGFADLHAHHASRWGFGGAWYWGAMDGALQPDPPSHSDLLQVKLAGIPLQTLRPSHANIHWPDSADTSHQQMGEAALREAHENGLKLIVAPAVNNEWFCSLLAYTKKKEDQYECQDMESAKYQIFKMKAFDEAHDWYEIVTNPWEARQAIADGHLAVVLGVEVSNILPKSDGPWYDQLEELYDMGVRAMYMAHESNSLFAGTAYHHTEDLAFPNKLTAWFSRDIEYASEQRNGEKYNSVGLSDQGYYLVNAMMDRHMLIDVDHLSRKAANSVAAISRERDWYPIYAGHTRIAGLMPPEQKRITPELNTPPRIFDAVLHSGGLFGMRTGPERVETWEGSGVTNNCDGSVRSLAQTYTNIVDRGGTPAFGSDLNGFVETTASRFFGLACRGALSDEIRRTQQTDQDLPDATNAPPSWDTYTHYGMADIATEASMVYDLARIGVDVRPINSSAQAYITMWKRTYRDDRTRVG